MSASREIIAALIAGGMEPIEAAGLMARAAVEMTAGTKSRSSAAIKQERYRRNKASQSVTNVTTQNPKQILPQASQGVTNRNENVTPLRPANSDISYLPSSIESLDKKESKKERKYRQRYAPLPDGWSPSLRSLQLAEEQGVSAQLVEQIFRDYLKSSGKLYADYDAAFNNFIRNQHKYNRGNGNGKVQNRSGGSLIDSLDRQIAATELAEKSDFALPADSILSLPYRSIRRS